MKDIMELRRKRATLVNEARQILDDAEAEKRDLSAEENEKYERIMADVDKLGQEIEREERLQKLESEIRGSLNEPHKPDPQQPDKRNTSPFASEEYRSAFDNMLRRGRNALDANEIRALQVGNDTEGGYLVPTELERTIIQKLVDYNIMRSLATVIPMSTDKTIPVDESDGEAYWIDEEGEFTESDVSFGLKRLGAHKVGTIMKVSEELLYDNAFNLEDYISNKYARRIGVKEEAGFVNGDGTAKPRGVLLDAQVGVTTAANNAITSDELIDLFHSLKRPYRARASWLTADSTVKVVRKLKDNDGQYIWQPGLQAGQPDRLLNRPINVSDEVPAIAASAKVMAFGDFSYYWIADRQGRVMQRLNELYAKNGQVGFRAYQRVDGALTLPEAVKVMQMHA